MKTWLVGVTSYRSEIVEAHTEKEAVEKAIRSWGADSIQPEIPVFLLENPNMYSISTSFKVKRLK